MKESYHEYNRVAPDIWLGQITRMNESCHTYEWVMPHVWMSHVTQNGRDQTFESFLSHRFCETTRELLFFFPPPKKHTRLRFAHVRLPWRSTKGQSVAIKLCVRQVKHSQIQTFTRITHRNFWKHLTSGFSRSQEYRKLPAAVDMLEEIVNATWLVDMRDTTYWYVWLGSAPRWCV